MERSLVRDICGGCSFDFFCHDIVGGNFFERVFNHEKCDDLVASFLSKLPVFMRSLYEVYSNYYYYFVRLRSFLKDFNLRNGKPLIVKLSEINYDRVISFFDYVNTAPWILIYVDCSLRENLDGLVISGQLFGRRKGFLFLPREVVLDDLDYDFFVLNQVGLPVVIDIGDKAQEWHYVLAEKWLQYGQVEIYPYNLWFRDYFFRMVGYPFYTQSMNGAAEHFTHYLYKDSLNLHADFLGYFYNVIDIESLIDQIKRAYFAVLGMESCALKQPVDVSYLDIKVNLDNVSLDYLVRITSVDSALFDKAYGGYVHFALGDVDLYKVLVDEGEIKVLGSLFLSSGVFLDVKVWQDYSKFYEFLRLLRSFPVSFVLDYDLLKAGVIPEPVSRFGKELLLNSFSSSDFEDVVLLFFENEALFGLSQSVEPLGTLFLMLMEGSNNCRFLSEFYKELDVSEGLNIIKSVIRSKMEGVL